MLTKSMDGSDTEKCQACSSYTLQVRTDTHPTWVYFRCTSCGYSGTYDVRLKKEVESNR